MAHRHAVPWRAAALAALLCAPHLARAQPEQVHISLTDRPNEMLISWAVRTTCPPTTCRAVVAFSPTNATSPASWAVSADVVSAVDLTELQAVPLRIINVRLSGLAPNTTYWYLPGGSGSGGNVTSFINGWQRGSMANLPTDLPADFASPPLAVYSTIADLGLASGYAMERLLNDSLAGAFYDAILHAGDIAYDLHSSSGAVGDRYMRALQPVIARVPYFVARGNHECALFITPLTSCFAQYSKRFSGIADTVGRASGGNAQWYSFDHGLVHVVVLDTELPFYGGTFFNITTQYEWLQRDLMAVNRSRTPWVVALLHKSIWMDKEDWGLGEAILQAGGVDASYIGHTHNYQRLLPQAGGVVASSGCVSANQRVYRNCPAMTTFVVGSAGNREAISFGRAPSGVAVQWFSYAVGYTYVANATHLYFRAEEVANINGTIIDKASPLKRVDDVWLIKTLPRALSLPVVTPSQSPTSSVTPSSTPDPTGGGSSSSSSPGPVAAVLVQWGFENTTAPAGGVAAATATFDVVGTAALWGSGYTSGTGAGALAVTLSGFPAQGAGNATSGAQACVSTAGYAPTELRVDLQASNTGSRFRLLQARVGPAAPWVGIAVLEASGGGVFTSFAVPLGGAGMADSAAACWRIVQIFAPGNTSYAAANPGSAYSTAGTLRIDNLAVLGLPVTPSATPLPAVSTSASLSASCSPSRPPSGSPTGSSAPTASPSRSVSLSVTASPPETRSSTRTGAATPSVGASGSGTAAPTLTVSTSPAATSSASGSLSASGTATPSPSVSTSGSASASPSVSAAVTSTPAATATPPPSGSGSPAPTGTSSPPHSRTATGSRSASASSAVSATSSAAAATATGTKTRLATASRSRTASATPSRGGPTPSRTRSATPRSRSRTPTWSASRTRTASRTKKPKRRL